MSITFFKNNHKLLRGFDDLPPWFWQPNTCSPYQTVLLYTLCSFYGYRNLIEIGVAEGYSSYVLGVAAKESGGRYLGIDIIPTWERDMGGMTMSRWFEGERLPVKWHQADTLKMTKIPDYSEGGLDRIDLAYIDGMHETEHILHEVYNLILPKANPGWSIIALDDVVDQGAQDAWKVLLEDKQFESVKFLPNGGFGILRVKEK
jgi:predicted O-methyltransferase YrrM